VHTNSAENVHAVMAALAKWRRRSKLRNSR
jgi:hypothetical protein